MNKKEFIKLIKSVDPNATEGVPIDTETENESRICFWDYIWDPIEASGDEYNTIVTYQISVISSVPRCKELLSLRKILKEKGINPRIEREYDIPTRRWHSFFSIDVDENIEDEYNAK